jgi:phage/plasmid-associated DNA primase
MRYESDSVYLFWTDCTEEVPGERMNMSSLYRDYQSYTVESGVKAAGRNTFIKDSKQFATDDVIPGLAIRDKRDPGFHQPTGIGRRRKENYRVPSSNER